MLVPTRLCLFRNVRLCRVSGKPKLMPCVAILVDDLVYFSVSEQAMRVVNWMSKRPNEWMKCVNSVFAWGSHAANTFVKCLPEYYEHPSIAITYSHFLSSFEEMHAFQCTLQHQKRAKTRESQQNTTYLYDGPLVLLLHPLVNVSSFNEFAENSTIKM